MNLTLFILIIVLTLIINYILIKKRLFLNYKGDEHQKFTSSRNIPLSGGLVLVFTFFCYLDFINFSYIILIFFLGFLSDLKKINSPKLRFIIQTIIVLIVVYYSSFAVTETKINFLDQLLKDNLFSMIFSIFCILVVINGCNFIDGVNTLLIGYCLIISLSLYYLSLNNVEISQILELHNFLSILLALLILNFFNKLYLGDGGAYFLGLLFALYLINTHQINNHISPYFIVSLLWYPAFENLFSILRKINFSRSPLKPDTGHLHQIIFFHLKKTINVNDVYLNTATGMMINFYNLISIGIATHFYNFTKIQILIIIFNVIIYLCLYRRLNDKKY